MTPSPRIIAFMKAYEKFRPTGYRPTPRDKWTVGWGTTGPDINQYSTMTLDQADERFTFDLVKFAAGVNRKIGAAPTTQNQFDALVSLAYNIGLTAEGTSTLLRLHNAGDYAGAASEFPKWDHQDGVVLDGLLNRRKAEAAIYLEAIV